MQAFGFNGRVIFTRVLNERKKVVVYVAGNMQQAQAGEGQPIAYLT